MRIKIDISGLEDIRRKINAPLKKFSGKEPNPRDPEIEIIRELDEGVEIDASEVGQIGPFLTYKGVGAILYIKDTMQTLERIRNEKDRAIKFHVVWCRTLDEKRRNGTFENRYVMTRRKDGIFKIDAFLDDWKVKKIETEEQLYVCQNCLYHLDYEQFRNLGVGEPRRATARNFDIGEFLDEYEGVVRYLALPSGSDTTEPLAEYNKEFARRSPIVKAKANYCCEECKVDLSNHRNLLHCHHKNHKKHDNVWTNLSAICALCHRDNHHKHMHVPESQVSEIRRLRSGV